jgi:predicted thioredoxin/glutaredoxin
MRCIVVDIRCTVLCFVLFQGHFKSGTLLEALWNKGLLGKTYIIRVEQCKKTL